MLLDKEIEIKWSGSNRKHYEDLGYKYTFNGDYFNININDLMKGSGVKVRCLCEYCNKIMDKPYYRYIDGLKTGKNCCKKCSDKKIKNKKTISSSKNGNSLAEKFPELVKEWNNKNKLLPLNYSYSSAKKVWWKCSKGHEWKTTIDSRTNMKSGCPHCVKESFSLGEKEINKLLIKYNINFKAQYGFKDLLTEKNNMLLFDFALFNKKEELKCLIEFDGIQHFKPTFGKEIFEITKHRDILKNTYCYENSIPLIRIKYDEINEIEDILLICAFDYLNK